MSRLKLQEIVNEEFEGVGIKDMGIKKDFIDGVFRDSLNLGMNAVIVPSVSSLYAHVEIGEGNQNFEAFIAKYDLDNERVQLRDAADRARGYMLDNCTRLTFTTTFVHPTTSSKKKVEYFHEHTNRVPNMQKRWKKRNDIISGLLAGGVTTALGFNQFVASQPLVNLGQQSLIWGYTSSLIAASTPSLAVRLYKNPQKVWLRERKYLGKEKIVEGEATLDGRYFPLRADKGAVYTGQFDKYELYNRYGRKINLRKWQAEGGKELFGVILADSPPPRNSLIWIGEIIAKIDRQNLQQTEARGFDYPSLLPQLVEGIRGREYLAEGVTEIHPGSA